MAIVTPAAASAFPKASGAVQLQLGAKLASEARLGAVKTTSSDAGSLTAVSALKVTAQEQPASYPTQGGKPVTASKTSKLAQARAILAGLIRKYPILRGTTVEFGPTPNNAQAVAYYTSGEIVINPNHRASLERIITHEVWHIIDWRDNGRIDWWENVPPRNR